MKNKSKLDSLYDLLKNSNHTENREIKSYIDNRIKSPFNDDLLATLLTFILDSNYYPKKSLKKAEKLYTEIVTNPNDKEEELFFLKVFINNLCISDDNINLIKQLNLLFEDKEVSFMIYNLLKKSNLEYKNKIINYIKKIRMFYLDEKILCSVISTILNKAKDNIDKLDYLFNEEINIYLSSFNVDEQQLINSSSNIENISLKHQEIDARIDSYLKDIDEIFHYVNNKIITPDDLSKQIRSIEIKNYVYKLKDLCSKLNEIELTNPEFINEKVEKLLIELEKLNKKEIKTEEKVDDIKDLEKQEDELSSLIKSETQKNAYMLLGVIKQSIIDKDYEIDVDDYNKNIDSIMIDKIIESDDEEIEDLALYYFALYNDTLYVYNSLINEVEMKYHYLERETVDKFYTEEYINKIKNNQVEFDTFYFNGEIDLLAQLIKINKDYVCNVYKTPYLLKESKVHKPDINKLKEAIKIFGIEKVAENNEIFDRNLQNTDIASLECLKEVYDINENYEVKYNGLIAKNIFFTIEQIVDLNDKQLKKICELFPNYYKYDATKINYDFYLDMFHKVDYYVLRKMVLSNSDAIININVYNILQSLEEIKEKVNFNIDDYLCLDEKSSELFISSLDRFTTSQYKDNKRKIKKILTENKKLIDKK